MSQKITSPMGYDIAYNKTEAKEDDKRPGVIFLHGLKSDKEGGKALHLEAYAQENGLSFIRMDCMAHGESGGDWMEATISHWRDDVIQVLDTVADQNRPYIIVGSSMGGWLGLLATIARPERTAGFVGIAAAPDFTEDFRFAKMSDEQKEELETRGYIEEPSDYGDPYIFTKKLIDDGRNNLLLRNDMPISCPVHLLQGKQDSSVPYQWADRIASKLPNTHVKVTFIDDGDHSLSRPEDLQILEKAIENIIKEHETCHMKARVRQSLGMTSKK